MVLELLFLLVLVLANGVLAGSEIAVVALRRARIAELAEGGSRSAKAVLKPLHWSARCRSMLVPEGAKRLRTPGSSTWTGRRDCHSSFSETLANQSLWIGPALDNSILSCRDRVPYTLSTER